MATGWNCSVYRFDDAEAGEFAPENRTLLYDVVLVVVIVELTF